MKQRDSFESLVGSAAKKALASLTSPARIQNFLDRLQYRPGNDYICPVNVLQRREAHCFDGAVFAAAALRRLGYAPKILYLISDKDDHHMLALFQRAGCWGAVSKSNYTTLGFREPVYRSIRELVMSYFDLFFNVHGYKSLRSYVGPLSLRQFDRLHWIRNDRALETISNRLDWMRPVPLLRRSQIRRLELASHRVYKASILGANKKGLYYPE